MTKKKTNTKPAETPVEEKVATRLQTYLIVGIKGSSNGAKVAIENVEDGRSLLKELQHAAQKKYVFFNEQRGLLFQGSEISHAFLTFEIVKG